MDDSCLDQTNSKPRFTAQTSRFREARHDVTAATTTSGTCACYIFQQSQETSDPPCLRVHTACFRSLCDDPSPVHLAAFFRAYNLHCFSCITILRSLRSQSLAHAEIHSPLPNMASSSEWESVSPPDQPQTSTPTSTQLSPVPTSEVTPEALADAAAKSPLAQKLKDKEPELVIDKPTKEFRRKRNSSASSTPSLKPADERHDSAGLPADLRPLTAAGAAGTGPASGSEEGDGNEREVGSGGERAAPLDVRFRKESIFQARKGSGVEGGDGDGGVGSVGPREAVDTRMSGSPAEDGRSDHSPLAPQPGDRGEGRTTNGGQCDTLRSDLTSPFDAQKPHRYFSQLLPICTSMERLDFLISRKAWRLFEVCDFSITPDKIRFTCQDILTTEWTQQVPLFSFIQPAPPAFTAAKRLDSVIREVFEKDKNSDLDVFEFCAGSSGPTPTFERLINQHRASQGERPIRFTISDLWPNHKAWKRLRGSSKWLDFEDSPVDAINPPPKAMSRRSVVGKVPTSNNM